jgi:hypothetical protein
MDALIVTNVEYEAKVASLTSALDELKNKRAELTEAEKNGQNVDKESIKILDKKIELQRQLIELENRERAKTVIEGNLITTPALNQLVDYNNYLTSTKKTLSDFNKKHDEGLILAEEYSEGIGSLEENVLKNEQTLLSYVSILKDLLPPLNQYD